MNRTMLIATVAIAALIYVAISAVVPSSARPVLHETPVAVNFLPSSLRDGAHEPAETSAPTSIPTTASPTEPPLPSDTPTPPASPTPILEATDPAPAVGEWGSRAPLLEPNSEMAVAQLGDTIYVIGGYPSTRVTVNTVQAYDSASDSWSLTTPLPTVINHPMAVGVGGLVYSIGGQTAASGSGPFIDEVWAYDPADESWSARAPMPTIRSSGVTVVISAKIYVAGGRPPHGSDFAVYDTVADEWETLSDLPTARNHIAAAAIRGKIYVVGGRFGAGFRSELTNVLEMYDPLTREWSTMAPMPTVRSGHNGIAAYGCFHVFGGEGNSNPSGLFDNHEVYDPRTDEWTELAPMPTPVHGVTGMALVDGWIHLPGGGITDGGSSGSTIHQVYRPVMRCE